MADEITTTEVVETKTETPSISSSLQASAWGDNDLSTAKPTPTATTAEVKTETQTAPTETITTETQDEVFDENDYIKKRFGYDSAETFENELKILKEKSNKTFEWKNDQSKQISELLNEGKTDELYNYLHNKKQVEKLTTADLTANKNLASELVKFGIQKDNPTLTADEVDFLFNQNYTLPEKPIQDDVETDEAYQARINAWQFHVNNIEKKLIIDAKIQQPKLAQYNNELVLPQIQKEAPQPQPQLSEEDIQRLKGLQTSFIENASKSLANINDFSVQVKNQEVDYNVSYNYSKEEKDYVNAKIKNFVERGFDANELFRDLWVESDGMTLKTQAIVEDLLHLFNRGKIDQKLTSDSADKRLEAYLKDKKQITLGTTPQTTMPLNTKQAEMDRIREQAFA